MAAPPTAVMTLASDDEDELGASIWQSSLTARHFEAEGQPQPKEDGGGGDATASRGGPATALDATDDATIECDDASASRGNASDDVSTAEVVKGSKKRGNTSVFNTSADDRMLRKRNPTAFYGDYESGHGDARKEKVPVELEADDRYSKRRKPTAFYGDYESGRGGTREEKAPADRKADDQPSRKRKPTAFYGDYESRRRGAREEKAPAERTADDRPSRRRTPTAFYGDYESRRWGAREEKAPAERKADDRPSRKRKYSPFYGDHQSGRRGAREEKALVERKAHDRPSRRRKPTAFYGDYESGRWGAREGRAPEGSSPRGEPSGGEFGCRDARGTNFPRGVQSHRDTGRWKVEVGCHGRTMYIGIFETHDHAAVANAAARDVVAATRLTKPTDEEFKRIKELAKHAAWQAVKEAGWTATKSAGVYLTRNGTWAVHLRYQGTGRHFGRYSSREEALLVNQVVRRELGLPAHTVGRRPVFRPLTADEIESNMKNAKEAVAAALSGLKEGARGVGNQADATASNSSSSSSSTQHPDLHNASSLGLKPLFKSGDRVYAAWWQNQQRSDTPTWYPGFVKSCRETLGGWGQYGPLRIYDVAFDDGDELDGVEDCYVFSEKDYLILMKTKRHDEYASCPYGSYGNANWIGVRNVLDKESSDRWANTVGWYNVTLADGSEQSFSFLSDALRAYDASVICTNKGFQKGVESSELKLNFPEEYERESGDVNDNASESEKSVVESGCHANQIYSARCYKSGGRANVLKETDVLNSPVGSDSSSLNEKSTPVPDQNISASKCTSASSPKVISPKSVLNQPSAPDQSHNKSMILSLKNPEYKKVMFAKFQAMAERKGSEENKGVGEIAHELFSFFQKDMGGDVRFLKFDKNHTLVVSDKDALKKIRDDLRRRNESSNHWFKIQPHKPAAEGEGGESEREHGAVRPHNNGIILSLNDPKYKQVMYAKFQAMGVRKGEDESKRVDEAVHELLSLFKRDMGVDGRFLKFQRNLKNARVVTDKDAFEKIRADVRRRNESMKRWLKTSANDMK